MRYPEFLKENGRIGFIAPSFGCSIEPYETRLKNALSAFEDKGYKNVIGPNCFANEGIGISNTPEKCADELNDFMTGDKSDVVISCGGGELMCEVVPFIDFKKISESKPKWYMGYSDNANYTFLSAVLSDTASVYGPCASSFGRGEWHKSLEDAFGILTGKINKVSSYGMWEDSSLIEEEKPLEPYILNRELKLRLYPDSLNDLGFKDLKGRLIGGCVDVLINLCGTKYDKTTDFLEKYKDDGFIWFLECCELNTVSMMRAFWEMKEAGWFKYVKGFLIGRPMFFDDESFGVSHFDAVIKELGSLNVPIIMDADIGHLPPMMPIVCGSLATINSDGKTLSIEYDFN